MEVPEWYALWIERHRRLFLLSADWVAGAVEWYDEFAAVGADAASLGAASRELTGLPPKFPSDHLPAVKAALGRVRDRAAAAERQADAEHRAACRSVCYDCHDTGWVEVPHPHPPGPFGGGVRGEVWTHNGHTADGEPRWVTCRVACRCHDRGVPTAATLAARGLRNRTLDDYERVVPSQVWRRMMRELADSRAAAAAAMRSRSKAPSVPPTLESLARTFAAGTRVSA